MNMPPAFTKHECVAVGGFAQLSRCKIGERVSELLSTAKIQPNKPTSVLHHLRVWLRLYNQVLSIRVLSTVVLSTR